MYGESTAWTALKRQRVSRVWSKETKGEAKQKLSDFMLAGVPKAVFVLMPMFALLLALFFRKPKRFLSRAFHLLAALPLVLVRPLALSGKLAPCSARSRLLAIIATVYLQMLSLLRRVYAPTIFRLKLEAAGAPLDALRVQYVR